MKARGLGQGVLLVCAALALVSGGCKEVETVVNETFVSIELDACLGSADGIFSNGVPSNCREGLSRAVGDGPVNACMVVVDTETNVERRISLKWDGQTVTPVGEDFIPGAPGSQLSAALFFLDSGFNDDSCAGLTLSLDDACDPDRNFCVLKLKQSQISISANRGEDGADGITVFDFTGTAGCELEWQADHGGMVEICDGLDNDCDGVADNGIAHMDQLCDDAAGTCYQPCSEGVGVCFREGVYACPEGGGPEAVCRVVVDEAAASEGQTIDAGDALGEVVASGAPELETCDGLDNSCNGEIDDIPVDEPCEVESAPAGSPCRPGVWRCVAAEARVEGATVEAEGLLRTCVPNAAAVPEICDDQDNNCNGLVDEGIELSDLEADIAAGVEPLEPDEPLRSGSGCKRGDRGAGDVSHCYAEGLIRCDESGAVICDAAVIAPIVEICNAGQLGADENCDGVVDEALGSELCGVGVCAHQQDHCVDGQAGVCVEDLGAGAEVCDAPNEEGVSQDENCNGLVNEDFPELGDPCEVGLGSCWRSGFTVCAADERGTTCGVEAGQPEAEICDLVDNDCDGDVDEETDTNIDPEHCGGCGNLCVLDNATAGCDAGACTVGDCIGAFSDLDGRADNGCECNPAQEDLPDPTYTDANCDGVDGDAGRLIFVSPNGRDVGLGTRADPVRTLARAFEAVGPGGSYDIAMNAGIYDVTAGFFVEGGPGDLAGGLVVPDGVSIYGGYQRMGLTDEWRRLGGGGTVLTGGPIVLRYQNLTESTLLDGVTIEVTRTALDSDVPSIGVAAFDVGAHLVLRDVTIEGGTARNGTSGLSGGAALAGAQQGANGDDDDSAICTGCAGLAGPNPACGVGTSGGDGGNAGYAGAGDVVEAIDGSDGASGLNGLPAGGVGGVAGAGDAANGFIGTNGTNGANGVNGRAGEETGRVIIDEGDWDHLLWKGKSTSRAQPGVAGSGGGGGGGGKGLNIGHPGGGGAGGGAGGCAGQAGSYTYGGGGSFGLYVRGADVVHLRRVTINGGRGGDGGNGGVGSTGAAGAFGGMGGNANVCATCGNGGNGGQGGRGGCGGHGGGGAGGPAFAIFRLSTTQLPGGIVNTLVQFEDIDGNALADQAAAAAQWLGAGVAGAVGRGGSRVEQCGEGSVAEDGPEGFAGRVGCCMRTGDANGDANQCTEALDNCNP